MCEELVEVLFVLGFSTCEWFTLLKELGCEQVEVASVEEFLYCHYMPMLRKTLRTSSMSRLGMRVVPGLASTRIACASNFLASSPKSVGMVRIGFAIMFSLFWSGRCLFVALFGAQR